MRETAGERVGGWLTRRRKLSGQPQGTTHHAPPIDHAHQSPAPELQAASLPHQRRKRLSQVNRAGGGLRAAWQELRAAASQALWRASRCCSDRTPARVRPSRRLAGSPSRASSPASSPGTRVVRSCSRRRWRQVGAATWRLGSGWHRTRGRGRAGTPLTDPRLRCSPRAEWAGEGVGPRPTGACEGQGWASALLGHTSFLCKLCSCTGSRVQVRELERTPLIRQFYFWLCTPSLGCVCVCVAGVGWGILYPSFTAVGTGANARLETFENPRVYAPTSIFLGRFLASSYSLRSL